MYLKKILLQNLGPISSVDIDMSFYENGNPKPVVIVGGNGSGKTILLSYIVDAIVEIAKIGYVDVLPGQGFSSPYWRVLGNTNRRYGVDYSFSILKFEHNDESEVRSILYKEQNGKVVTTDWDEMCQEKLGCNLPWNAEEKKVEGLTDSEVRGYFKESSYCFFPANRAEIPHWYNPSVVIKEEVVNIGVSFLDRLNKRPVVVSESAHMNQDWLVNVILDSRADFSMKENGDEVEYTIHGNRDELRNRRLGWNNINTILRRVMCDESLRIVIKDRNFDSSRLSIARGDDVVIPSLAHLSTGQSLLLNIFFTIIRYSEGIGSKVASLDKITGIVIIDEIDAHLHSDIQHDVLPELIKLFPQIQFIVTSHAPLFVLGMEREFGADGYQLLEMPNAEAITAERFSEFQRSFDYYQQTKAFDDEQRERLRLELEKQTRPLILTEGDTDRDYLRTALSLQGYSDLLSKIDIEWVGAIRDGKAISGGDGSLNKALTFLQANTEFVEKRPIMLLYDCDTEKQLLTERNLWVRIMPFDPNATAKKGVENLLPSVFFGPNADRRFYKRKEEIGPLGEIKVNETLNKRKLCDYICNEKREADDFIGFKSVIGIIEQFVNAHIVN